MSIKIAILAAARPGLEALGIDIHLNLTDEIVTFRKEGKVIATSALQDLTSAFVINLVKAARVEKTR